MFSSTRAEQGKSAIHHVDWADLRAYGGPGEQVNLDPWIDGLDVLDRREQVRWCVVDVEAGETVIGG